MQATLLASMASVTTSQGAHEMLVLQVYLGSNTSMQATLLIV